MLIKKYVLGLDPGIVNTGWAVLEFCGNNSINAVASGTIKTSPKNTLGDRIAFINHIVNEVIDLYKPSCAAIEEIFVNKNPRSSIKLSHARGAIIGLCSQKGLKINELSPTKVKKSVTGVGRADKTQVEYMIKLLIKNVNPKTEHESDAYAIAYAATLE